MTAPAEKPDAKEAYERWREGEAAPSMPSSLCYADAVTTMTCDDLRRADEAMKRILRACRESSERYQDLDIEEREAEAGVLAHECIVLACRALRALGLSDKP